ncbi:MAG: long-chain-fatty-acid--CoA ligase [marine bacterium B5-7]|nr:MAG: long-chain-fatty-acid--CoA ligase [marine bacterium B5-7]
MDYFWQSSYDNGVPSEISPDQDASLAECFDCSCRQFGALRAFTHMGVSLSYQSLATHVDHLARYLQQDCHIQPSDRVAIILPNSLQFPISLFAILKIGGVVVNVDPFHNEEDMTRQINDAGVTTAIVFSHVIDVFSKALPNTKVKHVITTHLTDMMPWHQRVFLQSVFRFKGMIPCEKIATSVSFKKALKAGSKSLLSPVTIKPGYLAFLQYTSGFSGSPKGVMLSHGNVLSNVSQVLAWVKNDVQLTRETVVTALPLYHIFSLTLNCFCLLKLGGHNVLVTDPRNIGLLIKTFKKYPVSILLGANNLFSALLHHPKFKTVNFSRLRIALGGGAPVQLTVARRWEQVTGKQLSQGYGLTEASPVVAVNPLSLTAFNEKVGLPLPSTEVRVVDELGHSVSIGDVGELWVRGPQIMQGYWGDPVETAAVMHKGWLATGDLVYQDEAGFLSVVDRKKDMIVVSGFKVYPNEVEAALAQHPDVREVAVVGVKAGDGDAEVRAFIVAERPIPTENLQKWCREHLTSYKIPQSFEFRDTLPKTSVGKILRRKLIEE